MKFLRLCIAIIAFFFISNSTVSLAQTDTTLADLITAQRLIVDLRVLPNANIIVGQKLALEITIATDRWFKGGTRIRLPEVAGLVILQTEQFASNASEQRKGESWVVQRWSIDVYPRREGSFVIPNIDLEISVAGEGTETIAGTTQTESLRFSAAIPPGLTADDKWVAAPAFAVDQRFNRDLTTLNVGDALEQTIILSADDVMAMMLPDYAAPVLEGLKAYPLPPQLNNSSNRGQTTAERVETVSYIAQAPGDFILPARDFHWWNTRTNELTLVSLLPTKVSVAGVAASSKRSGINLPLLATISGIMILLAGTIWLAYKWLPQLPWERLLKPLRKARAVLVQLRQPALPQELNPGRANPDRRVP
ncbi:MAG: BatD family protein [Halioglobus sp.]